MNNFWTVMIDKDGNVFLENETHRGVTFLLNGTFANQDEAALFASTIARKINGTL
jgi:hypothetical protein